MGEATGRETSPGAAQAGFPGTGGNGGHMRDHSQGARWKRSAQRRRHLEAEVAREIAASARRMAVVLDDAVRDLMASLARMEERDRLWTSGPNGHPAADRSDTE